MLQQVQKLQQKMAESVNMTIPAPESQLRSTAQRGDPPIYSLYTLLKRPQGKALKPRPWPSR
jgi:hypothetical protein